MTTDYYFFYFPAFFCSFDVDSSGMISNPKRVKLWLRHPEDERIKYNPEKTITIDLGKTPGELLPDHGDEIELDDFANGPHNGYTSFGPMFPHAYGAGGIYLSQKYIECHSAQIANALCLDPPDRAFDLASLPSARPIERLALLEVEPTESGLVRRRYHGFVTQQLTNGDAALMIVHHAGAADSQRAPRKLVLQSRSRRGALREDERFGSTFLEQSYARDVAVLDVPKRPSGSGEGLRTLMLTLPRLRPGPSLNVLSSDISGELEDIAVQLDGNYIECGTSLLKCLQHVKCKYPGDQWTNLDLIGHSRSHDGILKLGELPLTPEAYGVPRREVDTSRNWKSPVVRVVDMAT